MKIVVNLWPNRPKLYGKTFEDMEAWDILRSYHHISTDEKRHTITLGCRISGDRIEFKADPDAMKVKPSTFYRVISGFDEKDLFEYGRSYLRRNLTWEEKELALEKAVEFGDMVSKATYSQVFGYCVSLACQESLCAKCKTVKALTYSQITALIEAETIPDKWICSTCRKENEAEQTRAQAAHEAMDSESPDGGRSGSDDAYGYGGDNAKAEDTGVVLE